MNEYGWFYFGGIFDGEGSVCITKSKTCLNLQVGVTNTSYVLVEWLRDNFGGKIYINDHPYKNRKRTYKWGVYGIQAQQILQKLLPYSLIKQDQIRLALEFPLTKRGGKHSLENRDKRKRLHKELSLIKHVGVYV